MSKVIEINNLGKQYQRRELGGSRYQTLRDALWPKRKQKADKASDYFWALRNVDLSIEQGSVVGVIGPNGAGKSTLLKLLSRVTSPTEGSFTLRGRVASLLEVGTGFHPELTGRENILLSGAVMGMRKAEIQRRFDEIVAFSGVEDFLDLPVKRYSSGMYVRLGFAIAAHLEAEILLVDEVLAVGDAAFQKKCLGKIGDVAQGGRTVLFVSHNLGTVQQLCEESVLITNGGLKELANTKVVIQNYLNNIYQHKPSRIPEKKKGVGDVHIVDVRINRISVWDNPITANGEDEISIESIVYLNDKRPVQINTAIYKDGIRLFTMQDTGIPTRNEAKDNVLNSKFTIPQNLLRSGDYILGIGGSINGVMGDWFWSRDFCSIKIINNNLDLLNHPLNHGAINIEAKSERL